MFFYLSYTKITILIQIIRFKLIYLSGPRVPAYVWFLR